MLLRRSRTNLQRLQLQLLLQLVHVLLLLGLSLHLCVSAPPPGTPAAWWTARQPWARTIFCFSRNLRMAILHALQGNSTARLQRGRRSAAPAPQVLAA